MNGDIFFDGVSLSRVSDGAYASVVVELLRATRRSALCSLFIVDHALARDPMLRVDGVLVELAAARWRGVDARLLIGGSRTNHMIGRATLLAHARARELGIPCRLAAAGKAENTHAKLVVADDWVLTGSHNWAAGIFGDQTQDSVLLRGAALAASLGEYFERSWDAAPEGDYDVSL